MLEVLVHIDDAEAFLRQAHVYQAVRFDEAHVTVLDQEALPAGWNARPETVDSQSVGDEWLARQASVVLAVPSVVVPGELRYEREYLNYLVNSRHPEFGDAVQPGELRDLDWDPRFKRR